MSRNAGDTLVIGWRCSTCTLMNPLTRTQCDACDSKQPSNVVLEDYFVSEQEYNQLKTQGDRSQKQVEKDALIAKDKKIADDARKSFSYKELVLLERADLVCATETFDCSICFSECTPPDGAVLRECLHSFCKQCLAHTVEFCEEVEVKCPYVDNNYACSSVLRDREIKALVSPIIYEKLQARCVSLAENGMENSFHCKTADCSGWCTFEDEVNEFFCPVCFKPNCLTCQAIHDEQNCKEYQDELKEKAKNNEDARKTQEGIELMLQNREAMKCPKCEVLLMKKSGCDWLTCTMCKTEICWVTRGPRWGPKGRGDTSGGCKCRIGGGPCHPLCGNCH